MADRRLFAALAVALALAGPGARAQAAASAPGATASAATVPFAPPQAVPTAADPAVEARMIAITSELRCLVCQNQTIADSHADLAVDLRQEVREMIRAGRSGDQIRRYMTDRYGDFVLYRPPFKASTLALWLGPLALLVVAVVALVAAISRRARLADDRFEPDPAWDDEATPDADAPPDPAARPGTPA
ncbi:MAG: cytochrome c-type biogenesis protein [Burkholderiaceae bacterium]